MSEPTSPPDQDNLRKQAQHRVSAQLNFKRYLGLWAIISIFMVVIWAATGLGAFWPIWPIVGMGIAAGFMGWSAYGPRTGPTEEQIEAEMRRMQ